MELNKHRVTSLPPKEILTLNNAPENLVFTKDLANNSTIIDSIFNKILINENHVLVLNLFATKTILNSAKTQS